MPAGDTSVNTANPADLPSLEDLLSESILVSRETSAAKAAKARLAKGNGDLATREADAARVAAWQAAHEWEAVANVALFHQYQCACGKTSTILEGLYRRETHRHLKHGAQRHIACESAKADLPNEAAIRLTEVPTCGECMISKGWDLADAVEWEV